MPRKKNPDVIKTCPTCKKEFSLPYNLRYRTHCSRRCTNRDPNVIKKMKISQQKKWDEKYGGKHPMQTANTVNNFKKSLFEKYGDDFYTNYLVKKSKKTKLHRYGNENYQNMDKIKQVCLERYGVDNYTKTDKYKEKSKQTCLSKYGVDHPSKSIRYKNSHYKNMYNKILNDERFKNFEPLFSLEEYKGVTHGIEKYKFKCNRCNNVEYHRISGGFGPLCINCDKLNSSKEQKEIYDFIKEIMGKDEIILNNEKSILYPKEIDIYVPSKKIAIEYDSLFWHSEFNGNKNKVYHLNKTKQCIAKEIKLIHIFQTEWLFRKDVCKHIIKSSLNITSGDDVVIILNDDNYIIKQLSSKECSRFLNNNHIFGNGKSSVKLGLFYNNELISVMTFGRSRFDKKIEYEMVRFCDKINININNSSNKLFNYFIKNYNPKNIVTYSDRRFLTGELYINMGFNFIKNTPPKYYYIINKYSNIVNRMTINKNRIKNMMNIYDPNLTEWENMKLNGFDRLWDCGCSKYIWLNKN